MRSSFSAQPKYPLARKGSFYLSERQSGNGVLFGVLFNMALFDFLKDKKSEAAGAQPAEAKRQLVELALDPSFRTLLSREKPLMTKAYPSLHNPFGRSD